MSENIHTPQSLPDAKICNVYRHWAKGGWGMLITGMFYAYQSIFSSLSPNPQVLISVFPKRQCSS
jgi:2,4-dienoyl-CoA reductase-like NADH-dependent reductase (Old Yellow Enzyme family)